MIAFLALCVMAYTSSKPPAKPAAPPRPPSIEELGLKQIEEPDSADIGFFSSLFSSSSSGGSSEKKKDGLATISTGKDGGSNTAGLPKQ